MYRSRQHVCRVWSDLISGRSSTGSALVLRANVPSSYSLRMVRAVFEIATYQVLWSGDLFLYAKLELLLNRPEIFRGVRESLTTWTPDLRFLKNGPQVVLLTFLCRTFKSAR